MPRARPAAVHRRAAIAMAHGAALAIIGTSALTPTAHAKRVPSAGDATVRSVDGPGRMTLKTRAGNLKVRLFLVDTPEPGECGATESADVLRRLAAKRRGRVRYVLWDRRTDGEGRVEAIVGPRGADLTKRSLGADLVTREWARVGGIRTIVDGNGGITLQIGHESRGPRAPRGVWARCGGNLHLPAAAPVPAHAPADWTITTDGITTAIGPLALPAVLAPGTSLTAADIAAIGRTETTLLSEGTCLIRLPSLELAMWASGSGNAACTRGDVFGVATSGPGAATASNGLAVGQPATSVPPLFPRLAAGLPADIGDLRELPLAGYQQVPWAWQTVVDVTRAGNLAGFATTTGREF